MALGPLRQALQTHVVARRSVDAADRIAKALERELGPAGLAALRSEASRPIADRYARATAVLIARWEMFDGTITSLRALNEATVQYLEAYMPVLELAAETREAGG